MESKKQTEAKTVSKTGKTEKTAKSSKRIVSNPVVTLAKL